MAMRDPSVILRITSKNPLPPPIDILIPRSDPGDTLREFAQPKISLHALT